jgi:prolyl 4-hydroxylase
MNPLLVNRIHLLQLTVATKLSPIFHNLEFKMLHQNPPIIYIKNLLSSQECQHIIDISVSKLQSSTMIINNQEVVNPSRSSRSAFIVNNGVLPTHDPVLLHLLFRLTQLTGIPITHFEGMKVVNYQKGQQYTPHHDYFGQHVDFIKDIGDRQMTFFIYLNDLNDSDGGATSFPKLNLKVTPKQGDAVFWVNIDFEGNYFDDTFHAGEPVLGDIEKWGANIWVRQHPYH